jgi:hypothetical protein
MDDILSQATGPGPGRRPRRLAAIAVLVVLTVAIAWRLPRGPQTPAHRPATVTAAPVQLAGLGSGAARLLNHSQRTHLACPGLARQPSTACHHKAGGPHRDHRDHSYSNSRRRSPSLSDWLSRAHRRRGQHDATVRATQVRTARTVKPGWVPGVVRTCRP